MYNKTSTQKARSLTNMPKLWPRNQVENFQEGEDRGFYHKGKRYVHYTDLSNKETVFARTSVVQRFVLLLIIISICLGLFFDWKITTIIAIALLTIIYFADLLFNLLLIVRSFQKPPEISISDEELDGLKEVTLPTYTILCPLYKEWRVLPQFAKAIEALDYPKNKLQVLLLLEEDDTRTINKARELDLPPYFETVVIPHSMPKTKPKALNYGLMKTTGEMVVIYDAEDIPETDQLKRVVIAFSKSNKRVRCIQAKLNFYNPHQNIITKVFTAEYSLWFDLVLTGLQSINAPIPLGGTSNHFKRQDLIDLKGWDAFNMTEDCDLGMRLVKQGYRTAIVDSTTYEEANSSATNWFWQRTRWIKGYIQTYLVHMRSPQHFARSFKEPHIVTFQLVVGGKISSILINPIMWIVTISYFVFRNQIGSQVESFFPAPVFYMGILSLIFGNFLYIYYYMVGCAKREQWSLVKYAFLVPLYWLAMSLAAYTAWFKLLTQPHHWSKTKHGLHLNIDGVKSLVSS